jgi:hypothetical protein
MTAPSATTSHTSSGGRFLPVGFFPTGSGVRNLRRETGSTRSERFSRGETAGQYSIVRLEGALGRHDWRNVQRTAQPSENDSLADTTGMGQGPMESERHAGGADREFLRRTGGSLQSTSSSPLQVSASDPSSHVTISFVGIDRGLPGGGNILRAGAFQNVLGPLNLL